MNGQIVVRFYFYSRRKNKVISQYDGAQLLKNLITGHFKVSNSLTEFALLVNWLSNNINDSSKGCPSNRHLNGKYIINYLEDQKITKQLKRQTLNVDNSEVELKKTQNKITNVRTHL